MLACYILTAHHYHKQLSKEFRCRTCKRGSDTSASKHRLIHSIGPLHQRVLATGTQKSFAGRYSERFEIEIIQPPSPIPHRLRHEINVLYDSKKCRKHDHAGVILVSLGIEWMQRTEWPSVLITRHGTCGSICPTIETTDDRITRRKQQSMVRSENCNVGGFNLTCRPVVQAC